MINVLKVDRFGLIECDLQQHFMILKPITAASGKKGGYSTSGLRRTFFRC